MRRSIFSGLLVSLTLTALTVSALTSPAQAQKRVTVSEKIVQIEKQLKALQRRVFQTGDPLPGNTVQGNVQTSSADRRLIADVQVQISSLERQLRALTGQVEELAHRQRQNTESIELLRRDMDLRFAELGGAATQVGASGRASGTPVTPAQDIAVNDGVTSAETLTAPTPVQTVELPTGSTNERYQYAFAFVHKNELDNARIALEKFITAHAGDPLIGNAKYWLGRVHMQQQRPGQAANELFGLVSEYPDHPKRPDALVDLASVLIELDSAADACPILREFDSISGDTSARLRQRAADVSRRAGCS